MKAPYIFQILLCSNYNNVKLKVHLLISLPFVFCLFGAWSSLDGIRLCIHCTNCMAKCAPAWLSTCWISVSLSKCVWYWRETENYHSTDTVYLVVSLMTVVGGVFIMFALMALCYRSVVVHKNFSLCLRLVFIAELKRYSNCICVLSHFLYLSLYILILSILYTLLQKILLSKVFSVELNCLHSVSCKNTAIYFLIICRVSVLYIWLHHSQHIFYIFICVCVFKCMYLWYKYVYTCTHTHTHIQSCVCLNFFPIRSVSKF